MSCDRNAEQVLNVLVPVSPRIGAVERGFVVLFSFLFFFSVLRLDDERFAFPNPLQWIFQCLELMSSPVFHKYTACPCVVRPPCEASWCAVERIAFCDAPGSAGSGSHLRLSQSQALLSYQLSWRLKLGTSKVKNFSGVQFWSISLAERTKLRLKSFVHVNSLTLAPHLLKFSVRRAVTCSAPCQNVNNSLLLVQGRFFFQ